jgi:hypothetical protein
MYNPYGITKKNVCFNYCVTVSCRYVANKGVKGAVCGPRGTHPAGVCVPLKSGKCHLSLPSPMHACPCHGPWERLWMAKSCKGETQFRDAIIGTNQLRETTPTENPRPSKVTGVEHRASNPSCKN